MTDIKPQDIEALLETFDDSPWQEMRLKVEGLEMFRFEDARGNRALASRAHPILDAVPQRDRAAHTRRRPPRRRGDWRNAAYRGSSDHWVDGARAKSWHLLSRAQAGRGALCLGRPDESTPTRRSASSK